MPRLPRDKTVMSQKELAFFQEFARNGRNATEAYKSAVQPKASQTAANRGGSYYLAAPAVARAVAQLDEAKSRVVAETIRRYEIDQQSIASALARLGFSDIGDVAWLETRQVKGRDGKYGPKQVLSLRDWSEIPADARFAIHKARQSADGRIEVELHDKRQALINLAQVMGLITDKGQVAIDPSTGKPVDRFQPVILQVIRKAEG